MIDTMIVLYVLATANKAYDELNAPPPKVKVEKLEVDARLYYPDIHDEMWDPNWINKK